MISSLTHPDEKQSVFLATLDLAKGGDPEARNQLCEQFYDQVRSMVHRNLATDLRTNRPWLTARFSTGDVVQEVFNSVMDDLGMFEGRTERSFAGYLSMVIRNRIIDAIRFHEADRRDGRRSAPAPEHDDHASDVDQPIGLASDKEQRELMYKALESFNEKEQLLLRARFEQAASFKDLAEQLGYNSESTARRAFFVTQAKLALRLRRLKQEGDDA